MANLNLDNERDAAEAESTLAEEKRSERARRIAAGRLERAEKEKREAERLQRETQGGREAKNKAMKNKVWKADDSSQGKPRSLRGRATSSYTEPRSQGRVCDRDDERRGRSSRCQHTDNTYENVDAINVCKAPQGTVENQQQKGRLQQQQHTSANGSDSEQEVSCRPEVDDDHEERLPSGSGSDENDEGDVGHVDHNFERAFFVSTLNHGPISMSESRRASTPRSTGPSAQELFDADDDVVEMRSQLRSSSRAATLPPITDDDDFSTHDTIPTVISKDNRHGYTPKCTYASSSSRSRSRLPTSGMDNNDLGPESLGASESRQGNAVGTKGMVSRKRRSNFDAEHPLVQAASGDGKPSKPAKKRTRASFSDTDDVQGEALSESRDLRVIVDGPKLQLKKQAAIVQAALRQAIDKAIEDLVLRKPWPEESLRETYAKDILLDICRNPVFAKRYQHRHVHQLKAIIKEDGRCSQLMSNLVIDRLSVARGSAKQHAIKQIPHYRLGLDTDCKERVRSLLTDLRFHMPGEWGGNNGNEWQPIRTKSFLAPPVIKTIQYAYFTGARSLGKRYTHAFTSTIDSMPDEKEIPISMLALCLTAIYNCLDEFSNGQHQQMDFNGNTYLNTNQEIITLLEQLREERPVKFHERMHELFKLVSDSTSASAPADKSGAFTLIDM